MHRPATARHWRLLAAGLRSGARPDRRAHVGLLVTLAIKAGAFVVLNGAAPLPSSSLGTINVAVADDADTRAVMQARLGRARIHVQIDVGFGDAITPAPTDLEFPTLLGGSLKRATELSGRAQRRAWALFNDLVAVVGGVRHPPRP